MSYEPYSHMTVRPFKGDELMHDEYCDGSTMEPDELNHLEARRVKIIMGTIEESCILYSS